MEGSKYIRAGWLIDGSGGTPRKDVLLTIAGGSFAAIGPFDRNSPPPAALLTDLPAVRVGEDGRRLLRHGRDLGPESVLEGFPRGPVERLRVVDASGALLALAVPVGRVSEAPGLTRRPPSTRASCCWSRSKGLGS